MALDNTDVVDAIGVETSTGTVVLTISDQLNWDETGEHLLALQSKINRYLDFLEGGEVKEYYPGMEGNPIRIDAVFRFAPSEDAERFLAVAKSTSARVGWHFSWRVFVDERAQP
jgi:hypothetical protein